MALEKGDHVMGFDIIGRNGNDFRNNGYWWGPLADYCREVAPDITKHCKYWYSNDWDGLSAKYALALAERLDAELAAGRTDLYARAHHFERRQQCPLCEGTGTKQMRPGAGMSECIVCRGKGLTPDMDTYNPFTVKNVRDFVAFLRACGGFQIG
jgi:hypothetical protein